MIQTIELELELKAPANASGVWGRKAGFARARRHREQQEAVVHMLSTACLRPTLPCVVTLVRVAARELEDDNLSNCFKHIRDAIALWVHNMPLRVVGSNGKLRMPRAPDGKGDGITWRYDQDKRTGKGHVARIIINDLVGEVREDAIRGVFA